MPGTVGRASTPPSAVADAPPTPDALLSPPAGHRWADTPLGPREGWDPALRGVVDLVMSAPVAMALAYGDDLALIYNRGFAELIRPKHPAAFGRPAAEVFREVWQTPGVGDVIERVYRTGEPYPDREKPLSIPHDEPGGDEPGGPELVPTRGYSAVRDSTGRVVGVLAVVPETPETSRRLLGLGALASALADTGTLDEVARVTLCHAVSALGVDRVEFGVDDGGGWRVVRRVRGELLDEADERLPPLWRRHPADSPAPLVRTADSGTAVFTSDGRPLLRCAVDRHDERIRALAALPLRTPSLRGGLSVGYRRPHVWSPAERALLTAFAELVARAAERARRVETQHGAALLLQRSMLPEHLPDLPPLRVAARYDAGVDGDAGGDFYDAFALPDGRLAVVVGDVVGHDARAAALMGQVRAALRALALADPEPAPVLTGLDRLVASLGAEDRSDELFVTVVYGLISPGDGRLTVASAGHPPPLLRHATANRSATVRFLDVPPGVPLGLGGPRAAITVDFPPGDTLLLFSDGAVARRRHSLTAGLAALAAALATSTTGDPRALCVLASGAVAGSAEDDLAMLAVEHAATPSRSASMEVPAEPTAPGRVRRWMTSLLGRWGVPERVVGSAVLCTSELVTNALLHAGTATRVNVDLRAERLLVSVTDRGTRGAVSRVHTDGLSGRGRGLRLVESLSDAWGTDPTVRGCTVWFEMRLPPATPTPDPG